MKPFESDALKGASNESAREQGPFLDAVMEHVYRAKAFRVATELVAKWEHGSEEHREWLRSVAVPDIVEALLRWKQV